MRRGADARAGGADVSREIDVDDAAKLLTALAAGLTHLACAEREETREAQRRERATSGRLDVAERELSAARKELSENTDARRQLATLTTAATALADALSSAGLATPAVALVPLKTLRGVLFAQSDECPF